MSEGQVFMVVFATIIFIATLIITYGKSESQH